MRERIKACIATVFEIDAKEIPDSFSQAQVEHWDSIHHLNLIVELETVFNLSFEPDEIGQMIDIDAIENIIRTKQAGHDEPDQHLGQMIFLPPKKEQHLQRTH